MPGARSLLALLSLLGLGCAPRLPSPFLPAGATLLAGRGRITVSMGRYGLSAPCAFVLHPAAGRARVEVREPLGTTRLVLFLEPGGALLWEPSGGDWCRWEEAGPGLPFAPGDLWAAFLGLPPEGARGRTYGSEVQAAWRNGAGRIRGRFGEEKDGRRVFLQGPRGARMDVRFQSVETGPPPAGAFSPPPLSAERRTTLQRLLAEGEP